MKILITGVNGFLGYHLTHYFLANTHYEIIATGKNECRWQHENIKINYKALDITNEYELKNVFDSYEPELVIHTAAISKPNLCEQDKWLCEQVNYTAVKNIVNICNYHKIKFLHFSSDFIFGENGPHTEDAPTHPLNYYGYTKLLAENYIKEYSNQFCIIRPVLIYGPTTPTVNNTFLHWVYESLLYNRPIKVVNDQFRTPTFVEDICRGVHSIVTLNKTGVYHLAGAEILTPYQMAVGLAQLLQLNEHLIEPVTAATFKEPIQRAKKGGLAINKAVKELNYKPTPFKEGLMKTFNIVNSL